MENAKLTCSVLGANGYIGRHLVHFLKEKGFTVYAYGQNPTPHPSLPAEIQYNQFDIRNSESVAKINFNVDFVFVFSGITGTKISFEQYQLFTEVNEIGLLHVLNKISTLEMKPRVIFPSSRLVYKGADYPLKEEDEKEAKTIYAANKLNCERFLETYKQQFEIPFTIFRICIPYGNLFDDNFSYGTIGFFLSKAKQGLPITLFGDGNLKRTFTHIESLCEQIITTSTSNLSINSTFNISGETLTLKDVAKKIAVHFKTNLEYTDWPGVDLLLESGHTEFDNQKITKFISNHNINLFSNWIMNQ